MNCSGLTREQALFTVYCVSVVVGVHYGTGRHLAEMILEPNGVRHFVLSMKVLLPSYTTYAFADRYTGMVDCRVSLCLLHYIPQAQHWIFPPASLREGKPQNGYLGDFERRHRVQLLLLRLYYFSVSTYLALLEPLRCSSSIFERQMRQ